ncbi:hypothetical protein BKA83DRAFT_4489137 [Pisolithus microcarpus]|nr:hypothetical protein BKA83DRAFT_4489137 [Pisolithus microcarpus]
MALTAHHGRKTPHSAHTAPQAQDKCTYTSSGVKGSGSHFGLQTDDSQLPSFIGTQSLHDYEQSHTSAKHISTEGVSKLSQRMLIILTTKLQVILLQLKTVSQGHAWRKQRLGGNSGQNLSIVPEADNSQELDTNSSNDGHEEVQDGGDVFDDSQADRWGNEQHSQQHWSDDKQITLPSPVTHSDDETDTQQDVHLNFFGVLNTNTHQNDDLLSPLSSPSAKSVMQTQPLPRVTSKQPAQQCQHPSQEGLPSWLPHNFHSQSMCRPPVPSRLPSSQQGVSLQTTVASHHSEQVQSNDHRPSKKICPDATSSDQQSAVEEMMDVDNAGAKSGKCGRLECSWSIVVPKPTTLAFYPPLWMKLLDKAKARIWLHVATKEPSLRLETAVDGQCSEIIIKLVVKYQEDSSELEAAQEVYGLFNDMQTFWSKIKKLAAQIVPIEYNLSAPKSATTKHEWLEAVKQKAAAFLEGAKFLQGECDSLGRASNFAHSALQNICLAVYYSNSVKSLHQYIEFQHFVPYKALALVTTIVHSILSIYEQHGFSKAESLNMGELEDSYQRLLVLMDTVALDMYHGPKLTAMLEDWAQTGMTRFVVKDPTLVKQGDWEVILD